MLCLPYTPCQIGGYVPAAAAEMAPVDRIFTRIGAAPMQRLVICTPLVAASQPLEQQQCIVLSWA
jgi:hypothetical protein